MDDRTTTKSNQPLNLTIPGTDHEIVFETVVETRQLPAWLAVPLRRRIEEEREEEAYVELFSLQDRIICPECGRDTRPAMRPLDSTDQYGIYRACKNGCGLFRWDRRETFQELIAEHKKGGGTNV